MPDRKELFDFMLGRVKCTQRETGLPEPQAFGRWFLGMYFQNPQNIFIADGSYDGKVDTFFTTDDARTVTHHVLNLKYTREYNKQAPAQFYEEVLAFWQAFENKSGRGSFLEKSVKAELRPRYRQLFEAYDRGAARLMFVTNHRQNDGRIGMVENAPIETFHLDDLLQHIIDDIDGAMPRTSPLTLTGINIVLPTHEQDSEVPTSIVFAKLVDFINYMQSDPYDLLFMRNVRTAISLGRSPVNRDIRVTFKDDPHEFAYSNNGITILCEKHTHDHGSKELTLENPRVVNGSQTLHSVRDVPNPSPKARVMVRIIEIPMSTSGDLESRIERRKKVINKIATRSNQQNPIKKWDLVSNDDFQLELYRFFRQRGFFYERREREWQKRSRELKSVGVSQGPSIKRMAQLIASYNWNKKKLGPASARQVGVLFERDAYDLIRTTPPDLAYQLWWVSTYLFNDLATLAGKYQYIRRLQGYANFSLFAVATRAMHLAGARWGDPIFTAHLEQLDNLEWTPKRLTSWRRFGRACIDHIKALYEKNARAIQRAEGDMPSIANFFKSAKPVTAIVGAPIPGKLVKLAREALEL